MDSPAQAQKMLPWLLRRRGALRELKLELYLDDCTEDTYWAGVLLGALQGSGLRRVAAQQQRCHAGWQSKRCRAALGAPLRECCRRMERRCDPCRSLVLVPGHEYLERVGPWVRGLPRLEELHLNSYDEPVTLHPDIACLSALTQLRTGKCIFERGMIGYKLVEEEQMRLPPSLQVRGGSSHGSILGSCCRGGSTAAATAASTAARCLPARCVLLQAPSSAPLTRHRWPISGWRRHTVPCRQRWCTAPTCASCSSCRALQTMRA